MNSREGGDAVRRTAVECFRRANISRGCLALVFEIPGHHVYNKSRSPRRRSLSHSVLGMRVFTARR